MKQKKLGHIIVLIFMVLVVLSITLMWLLLRRDNENTSLSNETPSELIATTHDEERVLYYLVTTIEFMLGRAPRGYIFGELAPIWTLSEDGSLDIGGTGFGRLIVDDELADKVSQITAYNVIDIQIDDNSLATVLILVSYPDAYTIMNEVAEKLNENATIEELMYGMRQSIERNMHEMIEEVVSVDLSRTGNSRTWQLIRNDQLDNALSGNLWHAYVQIMDEFMRDFFGGDFFE